jgi:large subunit ribosomal protein L30
MAQLKITQIKSIIDRSARQKKNIEALGLKKVNDSVVHEDAPHILGMIRKVNHLIKVEKV